MNIQQILALSVIISHNYFGNVPSMKTGCANRRNERIEPTFTVIPETNKCNFTNGIAAINSSCFSDIEKNRFIDLINGLNEYFDNCSFDFVYIRQRKQTLVRLHKKPISTDLKAVWIEFNPAHFQNVIDPTIILLRTLAFLSLLTFLGPICCALCGL